ncbi:hypothetical protein KCU71_g16, partial [Aureobasidium melanogenum]
MLSNDKLYTSDARLEQKTRERTLLPSLHFLIFLDLDQSIVIGYRGVPSIVVSTVATVPVYSVKRLRLAGRLEVGYFHCMSFQAPYKVSTKELMPSLPSSTKDSDPRISISRYSIQCQLM